jgi:hypothetical protein
MTANLFKTLVLATSVLLVTAVHAKDTRIVNFPAPCVDADAMARFLVEFDETPALTMTTTRQGTDNKTARHQTLLFINYKTKSWSLVEKLATGEFCITGAGENVTPYIKKESK